MKVIQVTKSGNVKSSKLKFLEITTHHRYGILPFIQKIKARKHFGDIKRALKEVELIHTGKMQGQTLDDSLNKL